MGLDSTFHPNKILGWSREAATQGTQEGWLRTELEQEGLLFTSLPTLYTEESPKLKFYHLKLLP